ncbi:hypothetical protein N0V87_005841 [Didymella glomerata]|uniref:Alpha-ketoglutarate-dependent dioxygenase AlkB-like domain-containing protein n=1 Tax=Didymella glomerata TaxID=749621 RepID=A0A9W8WY10_9PLEO|nr:hypothetical protein N0V87_005841 [Didymella glomerata]
MPGLHIVPNLLPPEIQTLLLSRLLHRDLSNPAHLTNIHTHYNLSYPDESTSLFTHAPASTTPIATPLDPSIHKPLTVPQLLNKKMRWTTLGGQYDWTAKRYPPSTPPPFPSDIKNLLESIWTSTKAEAAIVNLYSPGDTLSVHRDVAEMSGTGLIVKGTCPEYLSDWPGNRDVKGEFEAWRGWMAGKRVNLNVRQMWD